MKEGYLFIPIKGERVDGHKFIPTVFEQGAAIVLSEHELTDPAGPYVLVESTTDAMKKLAAFYRKSLISRWWVSPEVSARPAPRR